jgi:LPS-assembly lipoprotein
MSFSRLIFPLIAALTLAACGFHLRGSPELTGGNSALPAEMAVTVVEAPSQTSELVRQLKRALRSADIVVAEEDLPQAALLTLREELDRRVLSVDSEGRAVEYELNYTVSFDVSRDDIDWRIPEQSMTLSRDYFFDRLDALAADRQEALLRQDMQREMARLVLDRIRAANELFGANNNQKPDAETQRREEEKDSQNDLAQ